MTNQQNSFNSMIRSKQIKRADLLRVKYKDIHIEEGFNLRDDNQDLKDSIDELANYIFSGGTIPPLEVRPRDEGGVYIVDGHRRYAAICIAINRGAPIEYINVMPFVGNDVDRLARIITSARNKPLTALEISKGYKRFRSMGLTPDQIAKAVNKSRSHVDSLLLLGDANNDVHQAVESGKITPTVATSVVREYGEKAGKIINERIKEVESQGKKKVTSKSIREKKDSKETRVAKLVGDMFCIDSGSPKKQITITIEQYINAIRDK